MNFTNLSNDPEGDPSPSFETSGVGSPARNPLSTTSLPNTPLPLPQTPHPSHGVTSTKFQRSGQATRTVVTRKTRTAGSPRIADEGGCVPSCFEGRAVMAVIIVLLVILGAVAMILVFLSSMQGDYTGTSHVLEGTVRDPSGQAYWPRANVRWRFAVVVFVFVVAVASGSALCYVSTLDCRASVPQQGLRSIVMVIISLAILLFFTFVVCVLDGNVDTNPKAYLATMVFDIILAIILGLLVILLILRLIARMYQKTNMERSESTTLDTERNALIAQENGGTSRESPQATPPPVDPEVKAAPPERPAKRRKTRHRAPVDPPAPQPIQVEHRRPDVQVIRDHRMRHKDLNRERIANCRAALGLEICDDVRTTRSEKSGKGKPTLSRSSEERLGCSVIHILKTGAAYQSGIRVGDLFSRFNSHPINSLDAYHRHNSEVRPFSIVEVCVKRWVHASHSHSPSGGEDLGADEGKPQVDARGGAIRNLRFWVETGCSPTMTYADYWALENGVTAGQLEELLSFVDHHARTDPDLGLTVNEFAAMAMASNIVATKEECEEQFRLCIQERESRLARRNPAWTSVSMQFGGTGQFQGTNSTFMPSPHVAAAKKPTDISPVSTLRRQSMTAPSPPPHPTPLEPAELIDAASPSGSHTANGAIAPTPNLTAATPHPHTFPSSTLGPFLSLQDLLGWLTHRRVIDEFLLACQHFEDHPPNAGGLSPMGSTGTPNYLTAPSPTVASSPLPPAQHPPGLVLTSSSGAGPQPPLPSLRPPGMESPGGTEPASSPLGDPPPTSTRSLPPPGASSSSTSSSQETN